MNGTPFHFVPDYEPMNEPMNGTLFHSPPCEGGAGGGLFRAGL